MRPNNKSANALPVVKVSGVEGKNTLDVRGIRFVLLREDGISPELQGMCADNLAHVVPVRISGIGIGPWEVTGVLAETASIGQVILQLNRRKFSPETVIKQKAHGERRGQRRIVQRRQKNMVARVACHEFIEQRRCNI